MASKDCKVIILKQYPCDSMKKKELMIHLQPTQWAVYLDEAPSVWRSKAHQSEHTTSPSSYSGGPCTGQRAG